MASSCPQDQGQLNCWLRIQSSPKSNSSLFSSLASHALPLSNHAKQCCLFSEMLIPPCARSSTRQAVPYILLDFLWLCVGYAADQTPIQGFLTTGSVRNLPFCVLRACLFFYYHCNTLSCNSFLISIDCLLPRSHIQVWVPLGAGQVTNALLFSC